MSYHEKHNARRQAGIVGEAVTSRKTSQSQNSTPSAPEQPPRIAALVKLHLVWLGSHGFLPVSVACWLIQALRLTGV